jgi:putative molybdopterin biosynthesis protein
MVRKEHAGKIGTLQDLTRAPLRFVNRQVGSGTRLLMDQLMQQAAIDPASVSGYFDNVEETHVAVAACVASGQADAGLGIEAAALEFGLHFIPRVEEDYFLACLKPNLDHPAVVRLRRILADPTWHQILSTLPGYAPVAAPGKVLVMTSALPWWRFTQSKRAVGKQAATVA